MSNGNPRGLFERPLGSGVWWINYYVKGKQHREKVGRKSDALKLYGVRKADATMGRKLPELRATKEVTMSDLIDEVLEFVAHHKDYRNYVSKAAIVRNKFGSIAASEIKPQDIERWLRSHCKSAATWNRYRAFFSLCYVMLALNGSLLQTNRAFRELTGLSASSLQRQRFQDLLSRAGGMFYETQFAQVILLRNQLTEVAFDLISSDGSIVPVLVNAAIRRDELGTPRDILMAVFNASHRRAYEQELLHARKTAEQMVEVIRHSSDAIMTMTTNGDIQTWNKGAEQIFGYAATEARGKSLPGLLFISDQVIQVRDAIGLLGRGRGISREFVGLHRTGKRMDLSVNLTPHMEAPGILVAFSAIIRDVTAQRTAEKALIQSEKLASVGRLASSIAHEINNPLEAVTNLLYILQSQVVTDEARQLVTVAQEELARVSHIANHTLRFHRQSTSPTDVDLGELIISILGLYRARLNNSQIAVELRRSDASPLRCYDGEMRQILMNSDKQCVRRHARGRPSHLDLPRRQSSIRPERSPSHDCGYRHRHRSSGFRPHLRSLLHHKRNWRYWFRALDHSGID
jgi:PAS domain S-box-containing protein